MQEPIIHLLDCTLRDGSYQIGFGFTAEDTAALSAGLDKAGFPEIEVGHGLGLGGANQPGCSAAATDEEYIEAARSAVKRAKLGVFSIAGSTSPEHVKAAAQRGIDFLRIGVDSGHPERAEKLVRACQDLGVVPYVFFMQSSLVSPDALAEYAAKAADWDVSTIYVVDSAGFMMPGDVISYVSAIRARTDATIGFHGHNNLHLAMANVVAAVQAGAKLIDCTLRGLGRSAGNAQTEAVAMVLRRLGYRTGIDISATIQLASNYIDNRVPGHGNDGIDLAVGYAGLHSRYLKDVIDIAAQHDLMPVELLLAAAERGQATTRPENLVEIARDMKSLAS
jgi:4-hydroxy 2-oxovalerate aldolase